MKQQKKDNKRISPEEESAREQLFKALADFQNLQKDMVKRLDSERLMLKSSVLKELLGLGDDLNLALAHSEDAKAVKESLPLIFDKYTRLLGVLGAQEISCKAGGIFDPSIHEAIGVVSQGKDGTIAKVLQKGYKIDEIIVRPVRVLVNKQSSKIINNKNG